MTHLSTTAKPLNKILACRLKTIYPCSGSGSASASPSFSLFLLLTLPPFLSLCCPSHIDGIYYICLHYVRTHNPVELLQLQPLHLLISINRELSSVFLLLPLSLSHSSSCIIILEAPSGNQLCADVVAVVVVGLC